MKANEIPEQEGGALPEGTYTVGIKAFKPGKGKESGIGYPRLHYVVLSGEYAGRYIFDNLSYSPKALWRIRALLEVLGEANIDVPVEKDVSGVFTVTDEEAMNEILASVLIGKEMSVLVNHVDADKEKGYQAKNEVQKYLKAAARSRWDE